MQRAQTSGEISREEMSRNYVCPTCTGRRIARWRATAWSDNQTAPGGRAAHIWSGQWGNRLFPRATRAVRDDCRATPPIAWCSNGSSEITSRDYNSYRRNDNSHPPEMRHTGDYFVVSPVERVTPCAPF